MWALSAILLCAYIGATYSAEVYVTATGPGLEQSQSGGHNPHRVLKAKGKGKLFKCEAHVAVGSVADLASTLQHRYASGSVAKIKKKCQKICTGVRAADCGGYLTSSDRGCYILPHSATFTSTSDPSVEWLCLLNQVMPAKPPPPKKSTKPPTPPQAEFICKKAQPNLDYDTDVGYLYDSFLTADNANQRCVDGCKTVYPHSCNAYALQNWQEGQVRCFVFNINVTTVAASNGFFSTCQRNPLYVL